MNAILTYLVRLMMSTTIVTLPIIWWHVATPYTWHLLEWNAIEEASLYLVLGNVLLGGLYKLKVS